MEKVDLTTATADINRWLDAKKVSEKKREQQKDTIAALVEAVQEGSLVVNDDDSLTYVLMEPVGASATVKELKFKKRLTVGEVQNHLQGVKASDVDGRLMAYVCALTNVNKTILSQLGTDDYSIPQSIAIFFL